MFCPMTGTECRNDCVMHVGNGELVFMFGEGAWCQVFMTLRTAQDALGAMAKAARSMERAEVDAV